MPRVCSVCSHPDRAAIDKALVAGTPCREIAALYRVSPDAVERHAANHLPQAMTKAKEEEDVAHAIDIVRQLKAINVASVSILAEARKVGDPTTALRAIDRIQRQIELQAKLLGELDERPVVNVLVSAEWLQVRSVLLSALYPYPDARMAVAGALTALEGGRDATSL
jgi:hypothetical protein